jgi:hypothetical protein
MALSPLPSDTNHVVEEAQRQGWTVISMKQDWKHIFWFDL